MAQLEFEGEACTWVYCWQALCIHWKAVTLFPEFLRKVLNVQTLLSSLQKSSL